MLSEIIRDNDLYALKRKVKQGYVIDQNRYVYDAIKTFDCDMIEFVLKNATDKHSYGEVYFFMIDSCERHNMNNKIECFEILLKFYKRPVQYFDTLKEMDRRMKQENERRLDYLEMVIDSKGKSHCYNSDIREMIREFL
jgi:hypothetical protein